MADLGSALLAGFQMAQSAGQRREDNAARRRQLDIAEGNYQLNREKYSREFAIADNDQLIDFLSSADLVSRDYMGLNKDEFKRRLSEGDSLAEDVLLEIGTRSGRLPKGSRASKLQNLGDGQYAIEVLNDDKSKGVVTRDGSRDPKSEVIIFDIDGLLSLSDVYYKGKVLSNSSLINPTVLRSRLNLADSEMENLAAGITEAQRVGAVMNAAPGDNPEVARAVDGVLASAGPGDPDGVVTRLEQDLGVQPPAPPARSGSGATGSWLPSNQSTAPDPDLSMGRRVARGLGNAAEAIANAVPDITVQIPTTRFGRGQMARTQRRQETDTGEAPASSGYSFADLTPAERDRAAREYDRLGLNGNFVLNERTFDALPLDKRKKLFDGLRAAPATAASAPTPAAAPPAASAPQAGASTGRPRWTGSIPFEEAKNWTAPSGHQGPPPFSIAELLEQEDWEESQGGAGRTEVGQLTTAAANLTPTQLDNAINRGRIQVSPETASTVSTALNNAGVTKLEDLKKLPIYDRMVVRAVILATESDPAVRKQMSQEMQNIMESGVASISGKDVVDNRIKAERQRFDWAKLDKELEDLRFKYAQLSQKARKDRDSATTASINAVVKHIDETSAIFYPDGRRNINGQTAQNYFDTVLPKALIQLNNTEKDSPEEQRWLDAAERGISIALAGLASENIGGSLGEWWRSLFRPDASQAASASDFQLKRMRVRTEKDAQGNDRPVAFVYYDRDVSLPGARVVGTEVPAGVVLQASDKLYEMMIEANKRNEDRIKARR